MSIIISPGDVKDAANGAYQAMAQADEAVLQAQNAIRQVMGIGYIPALIQFQSFFRCHLF